MSFTQEERMSYIGGSDIAAVMGQSRWSTPYRLWAEKTGKIKTDLSTNESVEMGTRLEGFVADLFSEKTGKQVRKAPKTYIHPDYPFLVAHVDRLVTGTDELLECKTCSAYKLEEWENKIPKEYVLQVIWYLGITGRKTGWIACLIGGQKFDYKPIEFDKDLFNMMVEKSLKFWKMVQDRVPPVIMPEDDEVLAQIYSHHTADLVQVQEMDERVAYLQEIKMHIDELQKEKREIETELKTMIADKAGLITDKYKVTWKSQIQRRIDTETFKNENPDLAQRYMCEKSIRVMRITKNKETE